MKKLFIAALLILLTLSAAAIAEKELYPYHELDMETYGEGTSTVSVNIHPDQIEQIGDIYCLPYDVYDVDLYKTDEVLALEPGDVICVYNELMTVESLTVNDGEIDINGGFFAEEGEQGATLWPAEEDPTVSTAVMWEDFSMTMLGQAAFQLADPVTVTSFRWNDEGDWDGEYDVAEVKPADFAACIAALEANDIYGDTTLTLEGGLITEIMIDWHP